jgi:hypothetical protein
MELNPFKSITGSDTFCDGSIPNPLSVGIPTPVSLLLLWIVKSEKMKYQKATWGYWKDYQEKLTKDRKGHKENQDELNSDLRFPDYS